MTFSLTWLPKVLRDYGLKVEEVKGWQHRGHGDVGKIRGVMCHHTAGSLKGNAPSLRICTEGRPDLPGPLSQLVLGRDGTFYVVAAGLSYHAGRGSYQGITSGNSSFIGIEADNTGLANDNPWPVVQMSAYAKGVAAVLQHIGAKPSMCVGHLEYALPTGRKSDPSFSVGDRKARLKAMEAFRVMVTKVMAEHEAIS